MGGLAGAQAASSTDVQVIDNAYEPASVTIEVGDTVRWFWTGENAHSVTSPGNFDSHPNCSVANQGACGSSGTVFTHTFDQPGEYTYQCRVHVGSMTGRVTVVEAEPSPSPTSDPSPTPEPSPTPAPSPTADPSPTTSASPTAEPSPTETGEPSPTTEPSPTNEPSTPPPSPSPQPPPEPTPSPTATQRSGPPPPRPTEPLPTITASEPGPGPSPTGPELEAFPSPPPLPSPGDLTGSDVAGEVTVPHPDDGGNRSVVLGIGVGALAITVLSFGKLVLFGPPWT